MPVVPVVLPVQVVLLGERSRDSRCLSTIGINV
jgi:hypothetical protein